MSNFIKHRRTNLAELMPYTGDSKELDNVEISTVDKDHGLEGGWIARNPKNHEDKWFIAAEYYKNNFASIEDADQPERIQKTLHNSNASGASVNVKDIIFWGDGDMFKLMGKASSKAENWMKSTKCMKSPNGVVLQVTTQQGNNVAEAVTFIPGVTIKEVLDDQGVVTSRYLTMM